jgi:hypothetical protein
VSDNRHAITKERKLAVLEDIWAILQSGARPWQDAQKAFGTLNAFDMVCCQLKLAIGEECYWFVDAHISTSVKNVKQE